MIKEIDWSKARIGQKVWCAKFGMGSVISIDLEAYPVRIFFEGGEVVRFTACGRLYFSEARPSLFAGHDIDYGELDNKFIPERRLGEITKNAWSHHVSDINIDDYEEAKNKGKHLAVAGFQSGVGLTDWNYAWKVNNEHT